MYPEFQNKSDSTFHFALNWTDTVGQSTSVTLNTTTSADVWGIVRLAVSKSETADFSTQQIIQYDINLDVEPNHTAIFEYSLPVTIVSGDFKIELGNTILQLTDMQFSTYNPNDGRAIKWNIGAEPIASISG